MSLPSSPNGISPYQAPLSNRLACERCRQHKLRCTRQDSNNSDDICTRCSRIGAACVTKSRGRVGRPKTNRHQRRITASEQLEVTRMNAPEDPGTMDEVRLGTLLTAVCSTTPAPLTGEPEPSLGDSVEDPYAGIGPTPSSSSDGHTGAAFSEHALERSLLEHDLTGQQARPHSDFSDMNFFPHETTQPILSPGFGIQSYGHDADSNILANSLNSPYGRIDNDHDPWVKLCSLSQKLHLTCHSMGKKHITASDQTFGAILEDSQTSEALRSTQDFCSLLGEIIRCSKLARNGVATGPLAVPDPALIIQIIQVYIYLLRTHNVLMSRLLDENAPASSNMGSIGHVMGLQIGGFNLDSVSIKVNVLLEVILQFVSTIEGSLGIQKEYCVREQPQTNTESILGLFPSDSGFAEICGAALHAEERVQHSVGGGGVRRLKESIMRAKKKCGQLIF